MSDEKKEDDKMNELMKALEESSAFEKKSQELRTKKMELDEHRVNVELERMRQENKELELVKSADYGRISDKEIGIIIQNSEDYMEAARHKSQFINNDFDDVVPFFRKNLILIGGSTNNGKSTIVTNIIRSTISQKNADGSLKRALVITNEQSREDFYNCTACQIKGYEYVNHHEFTDQQRSEFKVITTFLAGNGLVTVIDNNHNGSLGATTTVEGIKAIFDSLIENKEYYDVVLIDYYQNFFMSKLNPKLDEYNSQRMLAKLLDQYKNSYPAPIVLLAQSRPQLEDETIPFKVRLEGSKMIMNVATCVMEIIADRENLRTEWIVHKSRFQKGIVGKSIWTGYENGQFVPYNEEFKAKVAERMAKRQDALMSKAAGITLNKKVEEKKDK